METDSGRTGQSMNHNHPNVVLETLAAQGLGWMDRDTHSIIPPIYPSTTFQRNADLTYHRGRAYTRADNPTYEQASELLARLEGGQEALLFASGMAAIMTIFQALIPGDHIIIPDGVYCGTRTWLEKFAGHWGLAYTQLPNNDPDALKKAIRPGKTKIVWIETPSNPFWHITDIGAFSKIAHENDALIVTDNTVSTPVLTRPIVWGSDIVMHSATKYLNGHGDILMGGLVTKKKTDIWKRIHAIAHDGGALPGSFETWLLLRGMRTLFLRMARICSSAMVIAEYLNKRPEISKVYYPGLPEFPGHEIAKQQMRGGFGGMLSIRMKEGYRAAVKVQAVVQVFKRATSLGLTESLIEHRASYEGPGSPVPDDLLRISIGIEDMNDLIYDLDQALLSV